MNLTKHKIIGLAAGVALLGALTGCVVEEHHLARVYAAPPPPPPPPPLVYVQPTVVVQDDYVYYPGYEVYYSSSRHNYIYMEGRSWVTRPTPPRVSVNVLFASPSVRLDFHDSPSAHHATVIKQYPKHWAPGHDRDGRRDDDDKKDKKDKKDRN